MGTKFCVTVDAGPASGVTTGVSAFDRGTTIRALANPATVPTELVRPGHVFPLRYTEGGVLVRGGHTEASVDLCLLAGLEPVRPSPSDDDVHHPQ
jgi:3,4-dihydroxy 2-butanone 4-phosphate synthase/GTP cyclohydrolase II